MSLWEVIILGVVEGLTEYLPISSTGHLILVSSLLGLDETAAHKEAIDSYAIVIQGGAILAVLGLYRRRVLQMIAGALGRDAVGRKLAINIVVAFLPAAIVGLPLDGFIEERLFATLPVIIALAVGGIVLIALPRWQQGHYHGDGVTDPPDAHSFVNMEHLTWKRALLIGLLQCLALWPGTSRSMVTIAGGLLVGMRPKQAAEFSFLLALPTLGGACIYKLGKGVLGDETPLLDHIGLVDVIVGMVVAMITAMAAVRWMTRYLTRHGVAIFGWYRLVLCLVFVLVVSPDKLYRMKGGEMVPAPVERRVPDAQGRTGFTTEQPCARHVRRSRGVAPSGRCS